MEGVPGAGLLLPVAADRQAMGPVQRGVEAWS